MFKKIQELLEAGDISESAAKVLDSEVSGELKTLRDESASWRVKYQELNTKFESISKTKDDLELKLGSLDEQIAKAREEGKKELVGELESTKKQQEEISKAGDKVNEKIKEIMNDNLRGDEPYKSTLLEYLYEEGSIYEEFTELNESLGKLKKRG